MPFQRARKLLRQLFPAPQMSPARAYDLWSSTYDEQSDNPLLFVDDELFGALIRPLELSDRVIVDVGCGTGRHWEELLARQPARLVGYDVSSGMLARLRAKFPGATVHQGTGQVLHSTRDRSCDLVVSTLTLGYIEDLAATLAEWARVLQPGGDVILTDLHPAVAATGDRGFRRRDREIPIRHHVHALGAIQECAAAHGLRVVRIDEKLVDDSVRPYYAADDASVALFSRLLGKPLMYGLHLSKSPGAAGPAST